MALLAERTELEIFLRQCVDDVRKEIARNSKTLRTRPMSESVCEKFGGRLGRWCTTPCTKIPCRCCGCETGCCIAQARSKDMAFSRDRDSEVFGG